MSEEEQEYIEHEIVDRLYSLEEKDFDKTKVTNDYIQAVLKAGKENKKLVEKLQKENNIKDKVIDNLYADIEYEYSGTNYLKSLDEYYEEAQDE